MKKILIIATAFILNTALVASDYIIPIKSIFASQMMPRYVGITSTVGYDLKISNKTLDIADEIRTIILPQLKPKMKKLTKLESKVFELSLKQNTHKQIVVLLEEIAELKFEASLVQLQCIELYKKRVSKKDFEKVKEFLKTKKDYIFKYVNILQ
ncbi:MAG: hypothetical protein KAJ49_05365 [Arcobacteraceae bacterium]|nr:hypothetical protein [Arcobacteraceae bacterium]